MPAGSELVVDNKPATIVWAAGDPSIVDVGGKRWLMSHMTPAEMAWHRNAYEPGSLVQEWVVRESVDQVTKGSA